MGQEADQFLNGSKGQKASPDAIAVTKSGRFRIFEAKGGSVDRALEQLQYTSDKLGANRIDRQTIVFKEAITSPGYSVENGKLMAEGKPVLIGNRPVYVKFTTPK